MKKYFSILPCLVFSTFLLPSATFAASPIQTGISAGYTYDDNVTRAELDQDIEKDSILNLDASAHYKIPLNLKSYFSLKGTVELNKYLDFDKLSNNRLGIHGSYHIRPFNGYTATKFFARLSYVARLYNSDQRTGSATYLQLGLNKRLSDVVTIYAGYIKENIDSDESKGVFDLDNNRLYLETDFKTGKNNTLYATLNYIDGDVVSTTIPNSTIIGAAEAIVRDDAFLDLTPDRWAYKLSAKTTTLEIGDTYAIRSNQAVDASVLYYRSKADAGIVYSGLIASLSYYYRF